MTFDEFYRLLTQALDEAVKTAEQQLHRKLPANSKVVLHGAGHRGDEMDSLAAAKILYLGNDRFYRIIDVAVIKVGKTENTIFVRASAHSPSTFDKTWNNPPGMGPFKQLVSQKIQVNESDTSASTSD